MDNVHLPILDTLLSEGVPRGRTIAVFFDPASEWYSLIEGVAAKRLQEGQKIALITTTRFPDQIRGAIRRFQVDPNVYEDKIQLFIADWYSWLTGRAPKLSSVAVAPSLRVGDLGIILRENWYSKEGTASKENPLFIELAIFDNLSTLFTYNPEDASLRFLNTAVARAKQDGRVVIAGFATKVHGERVYANLEAMNDGVLDVATRDIRGGITTFVRVRNFVGVRYERGWHLLRHVPDGLELLRETGAKLKIRPGA